MAKRQTMNYYKAQHRRLKIKQQESHLNPVLRQGYQFMLLQ